MSMRTTDQKLALTVRSHVWVRAATLVITLLLLIGAGAIAFRTHAANVGEHGKGLAWLLTVGKIAGLLATMLLIVQVGLSSRFVWLDRAFGLDRLLRLHRLLGVVVVSLACLHPLCIYSLEAYKLGPLRWSLWPQMLGAASLVLLCAIACTSLWRAFLGLSFEAWRRIHQLTFLAAIIALIHGISIGSDFRVAWLKVLWLLVAGGCLALFFYMKLLKPVSLKQRRFTVASVRQLNHNVCQIELAPPADGEFRHLPGQFAFLRVYGKDVSREEHPFTISSSPGGGGLIRFTIKASGDYTRTVPGTKVGDTATVDGPYGRFSHVVRSEPGEDLLMIAGGVGITPMLSMLGYLADTEPERRVMLLWGNRTSRDIFAREELERLQSQMPQLRTHHILSEEPGWSGETGFVDESFLRRLLADRERKAQVFLCGPTPMMDSVAASLRKLGFPRRRIHTERFSL